MTVKQIEKYKKLGWEFKEDQTISHHNGDIDDELHVKSPRLDEFFCVARSRCSVPKWNEVEEKEILKREKQIYAAQWYDGIGEKVESLILDAVIKGKMKITINLMKL